MPTQRPTSPHLSIYRPQISSTLSILHRITGVGLYGGTLLLAAWLWCSAYDARSFNALHTFMTGMVGEALLIGWTLAFYYHLFNGIRHLWWDIGRGFSLPAMARTGWLVIILAIGLTALTWFRVLGGMS